MPKVIADPTPAGARVLRQLAKGGILMREQSGSLVLRPFPAAAAYERLNPITVEKLIDRGYLARKGGGVYELTDAGREALEVKP